MELKNVAPASLPNLNICHTVSPVWKVPQLPAGGGVEGLALAGVSRRAQFSQARYLVPGFHPTTVTKADTARWPENPSASTARERAAAPGSCSRVRGPRDSACTSVVACRDFGTSAEPLRGSAQVPWDATCRKAFSAHCWVAQEV